MRRPIGVTIRSITGYVDYEVYRNADNDFTATARNVDGRRHPAEPAEALDELGVAVGLAIDAAGDVTDKH